VGQCQFPTEIPQESTLYIGAVAFCAGVIAWVRRRELQHPEILSIASLVALAGFVLALGMQLHWAGNHHHAKNIAIHFSLSEPAQLPSTGLLFVSILAFLFQNAGDNAFWAVHIDLYQPDGRPWRLMC